MIIFINASRLLFLILLVSISLSVVGMEKMNILILNVDDLKPSLGCYGDTYAKTPHIDRLADEGTVMLANYCQQAVCAASRVSMYTGVRPDSTGVLDLHTYMRDIRPDIETIPEYFKKHGYVSIGFGKILHGAKNDDPQSWSERIKDTELPYANSHPQPVMGKFQTEAIHDVYEELVTKQNGKYLKLTLVQKALKKLQLYPATESYDLPDDAYTDGAIAKAGIERLKRLANSKEPFCMVLGFRKPHLPFNAPKKYWDMYAEDSISLSSFQNLPENAPKYAGHTYGELGAYTGYKAAEIVTEGKQRELIHGYYACVSYIDTQIGKVMNTLKGVGLDKNTVVVLWGDHGWHLGDHGLWCKHSNFEQATAAPLIISAPGMKKGQRSKSHSEFVDIFPTLCDLVGLPIPEQVEGDSLVPVLKDASVSVKEYSMSQYPRGKVMGYSLRSGRYRLVCWMEKGFYSFNTFSEAKVEAMELYDYQQDPLETINQSVNPEYVSALESMKTHMHHYFKKYENSEKAATIPALIKSKSRKK